jgi:hypothetical protein
MPVSPGKSARIWRTVGAQPWRWKKGKRRRGEREKVRMRERRRKNRKKNLHPK